MLTVTALRLDPDVGVDVSVGIASCARVASASAPAAELPPTGTHVPFGFAAALVAAGIVLAVRGRAVRA